MVNHHNFKIPRKNERKMIIIHHHILPIPNKNERKFGSSQKCEYPKKQFKEVLLVSLEYGNPKKKFKEAVLVHHQHLKIPRLFLKEAMLVITTSWYPKEIVITNI